MDATTAAPAPCSPSVRRAGLRNHHGGGFLTMADAWTTRPMPAELLEQTQASRTRVFLSMMETVQSIRTAAVDRHDTLSLLSFVIGSHIAVVIDVARQFYPNAPDAVLADVIAGQAEVAALGIIDTQSALARKEKR